MGPARARAEGAGLKKTRHKWDGTRQPVIQHYTHQVHTQKKTSSVVLAQRARAEPRKKERKTAGGERHGSSLLQTITTDESAI